VQSPNPGGDQLPAQTVTGGTLRAQLKAETAHLHAQIEKVVPLLRPSLDRASYRAYLARLIGYQRPLEARLAVFCARWRDYGLDFEERRKEALLVGDLRALGFSAAQFNGLPECAALPSLSSFADALGCLYVLEGSTLGGQIILRTVGPRLQLSPSDGLSFLSGYGEQTRPRWDAFTHALGRFDVGGGNRLAVVRGACETFATQMEWLNGSCA
jgi:heme oxygenase (biliverdin-IX-beta and delta-forming)